MVDDRSVAPIPAASYVGSTARADGRRLFLGLLLWAIVAAVALHGGRPPEALPLDAPADVAAGGRALEVLRRLARDDGERVSPPRPVGTQANARSRERILMECRRVGLFPEVDERFAVSTYENAGGVVRNVVARMRGSAAIQGPGRAILCMAHYDSVGAGPGVSDDLAGVAALLEAARALKASGGTSRDVIFLFEDAEEHGLLGAEAFAAQHPWAEDVGVAVNLEARGTSGPSRLFETGAGNAWAVEAFAGAVPHPSASSVSVEVYRRMPNDTDYTVWRQRDIPGLNFAFIGDVHRYHTPLDDLGHVSPESVQHHASNALAAIRALDGAVFPVERGERVASRGVDAAFFDVAGRRLVSLRVRTLRLVAGATFLLALVGLGRALSSGAVRPLRLALALVLVPATLAGGALVAHLDGRLLAALGGPRADFPAHLPPTVASYVGATLGGLFLLSGALRRAVSAAECGAAVLATFALLGLVLSWAIPGTSYLFVLPALVLALGATLMRTRGDVDARWGRASIAALPVAALLWTGLHGGVVQAFGVGSPLVVAGPLLLVGVHALPLLVRGWSSLAPWATAAALALALLAAFFASILDTHTADRPSRINLVHVQSGDGEARWQVYLFGDPVPPDVMAGLRDAAGLPTRVAPVRAVSWSGSPAFAASTRPIDAEPPVVEVLAAHPADADSVRAELRVTAPGGADQLVVQATGATSMRVGGVVVRPYDFSFLGPGADPCDFELQVPAGGFVELTVRAKRFGLDGVLAARAQPLLDARPGAFVPSHDGDGSAYEQIVRIAAQDDGSVSVSRLDVESEAQSADAGENE